MTVRAKAREVVLALLPLLTAVCFIAVLCSAAYRDGHP